MTHERFNRVGRAFHPSSVFDRMDWLHGENGQRFRAGTRWRREFGFGMISAWQQTPQIIQNTPR